MFWQKFYNTKVAEHTQRSGGGLLLWTPNQDLEGAGPSVLLELWSLMFMCLLVFILPMK